MQATSAPSLYVTQLGPKTATGACLSHRIDERAFPAYGTVALSLIDRDNQNSTAHTCINNNCLFLFM
ncbi:hypothetical protein PtrSN002B_004931 [Pyrenophora tritici-repentis]|nr:hypothetical protein PtrSN001A_004972 [Pyrenophora tritici-repentis]KAI1543909.1 hypothetical protein PtrSN001C_003727 [Pyrenophora tritici-repentis]KAI1552889.1 hypothetical protein PtrSN002B_004931 [Pyrenophora tritici-repentis]KAI1572711.1 hypothetical protein PtrEW4_004086 [Pyrenophora tritici-repentis]KAI1581798.1 hypothetical protein PtrEW7m1_004229 [Pyrenophora tritici-repentis]